MAKEKKPGEAFEKSADESAPAEQLKTRHVFLDTELYRSLGHSPANRALTLLKDKIEEHLVVLHTTDITLMEVSRQIREKVLATQRDLTAVEKQLSHWRKRAPEAFYSKKPFDFDAEAVAHLLYDEFLSFLLIDCHCHRHNAAHQKAVAVLESYFRREPPFDRPSSKEFPDALTLNELKNWCREHESQMYIVTKDAAFARAVKSAPEYFFHLPSIHSVLGAAAALGEEGERAADEAINQHDFDGSFELALTEQIEQQATFIYVGDLAEGEAYDGRLIQILNAEPTSTIGMSDKLVTLTMNVSAEVETDIEYEDRSTARYHREDDTWIGSEIGTRPVTDLVEIPVLVEVERRTGKVREVRLIDDEIRVHGPLFD